MPLLDFKEIPEAHRATGAQDTFELFARDFFTFLGYRIIQGPSRGADGGTDLIIEEARTGISGTTNIKWLVSCKHKAHSGASVLKTDEPEVKDSVESKSCQGFIGFYSTLPSSGLVQKVSSISSIEHQFFDFSKIELYLLSNNKGRELAKRYFPISYEKWIHENPKKAQIFSDTTGLLCKNCGEDITEGKKGIVVSWEKYINLDENSQVRHVKSFYWCCKGRCDSQLKQLREKDGYHDAWEDIYDLRVPTIYIRWVMGFLNNIYGDYKYSSESFEAQKEMLIELFPYVARNLTQDELKRLQELREIPALFGGLGYLE